MYEYAILPSMNKINNKTILLSLGIMAILILGLMAIPTKINAQSYGGYIGYGAGQNNNQNYYQPIYISEPVYIPAPEPVYVNNPAPTPTIYSSSTNPNPTPAPKAVAKTNTTNPTTTVAENNLTAGAIFGLSNFMPSNLIEWILFAILILLIVALVRKLYGGNEKYDAIPMKHK